METKNKQVVRTKHLFHFFLMVEQLDYGTTACVAIIRPSMHQMTLGWLGDARAAVVRWETVVSTPRIETDTDSSSNPPDLSRAKTIDNSQAELLRDESYTCSPYLNCDSPLPPGSPASSTTTLEDSSSSSSMPTLQVIELTNDHVPSRDDERERVLNNGGIIRRVGGVIRVVAGGDFTEEQLKQQRLALNVSFIPLPPRFTLT